MVVKAKTKLKRIVNIVLGILLFVFLIGYAFKISLLFGILFVLGFVLSIYKGELKKKPWKPIVIFVGALITRAALNQFLSPVLASKTLIDIVISILIFILVFLVGWRIKKS